MSLASNLPLHSIIESVQTPDDEVFMLEPEFAPPENSPTPESDFSPATSNPLVLGKQVAPWWHTILFVLILIGISALGAHGAKKQQLGGHQMATYISTIVFEFLMLAFAWWGLRLRRIPLKSILGERHKGWSGLGRDVLYAAVFCLIASFILGGIELILKHLHIGKAGPSGGVIALAPATTLEFFIWFLVCATAGLCEELVFRGYFLSQFSSIGGKLSLSGKIFIGVVLSSLVFGISHGYEGIDAMIGIFIFGALFCLLALKSKTLKPGMFAHGAYDFFVGVFIALHPNLHHMPR